MNWESDTLLECVEGFEKVTERCKKLIDRDESFIEMLAQKSCDPRTLGKGDKEVKAFKE